MSGGHRQDVKEYQQMLRYNLKAKSLFDNGAHAQQTPSSTYFLTDKITRYRGVFLNIKSTIEIYEEPKLSTQNWDSIKRNNASYSIIPVE